MPRSPQDSDEQPGADPRFLFHDDASKAKPQGYLPATPGDGYDLEAGEAVNDESAARSPVARAPIAPKKEPRPEPKRERTPVRDEDEATVDEIWTRQAEWGPTLIVLAGVALGVLIILWMTLSAGAYSLAFFLFLIGSATLILLSYPIVITLERPVRMTPEQALQDYYGALSHHFPHYRRMWLLLSTRGKNDREFKAFPAFRAYWKHRLAQLRGGKIKPTTPLMFEIAEFRGDKSAGKTSVDVSYKVIVRARGENTEPIESVRLEKSMAKGPDNMWYLNFGTLPGRL